MYDNLTKFETRLISRSSENLAALLTAKLLSDLLVVAVVVLPRTVPWVRPLRVLWLATRLRDGTLMAVSAIWITAGFRAVPANEALSIMRTIGPAGLLEPPHQSLGIPDEYLRPWRSGGLAIGAAASIF